MSPLEAPSRRNLFEVENARNLTAHEIASTFVPTQAFWRLLSPKNQIVMGARGSGKTVLARMLAHDHLSLMENDEARSIISRRRFIGVYTPMKLEWVGSLRNKPWFTSVEKEEFFRWRLNIATCQAYLHTARSCLNTYLQNRGEIAEAESRLVSELSEEWMSEGDRPETATINALKDSLRSIDFRRQQQLARTRARMLAGQKLEELQIGLEFNVELFAPLRRGIDVLSRLLNIPDETAWLLCLDEAEFLDESHHRILNSFLRAHSDNLFFKITTMPYQHHTLETNTAARLDVGQDFDYLYIDQDPVVGVDLEPGDASPERQSGGWSFARQLFKRRADASGSGFSGISLDSLLGRSILLDSHSEDWQGDKHYRDLIEKYCDKPTLKRAKEAFAKIDRARSTADRQEAIATFSNTIGRKLRGALILKDGVKNLRGAAKLDLYSGASLFIRCGDGNPRRLIRMLNSIFRNTNMRTGGKSRPIVSATRQNTILEDYAESTLKRVQAEMEVGPDLYAFINRIGRSFSDQLHKRQISTDLFTSFHVTPRQFENYRDLIERGVGLGLIFPNVAHESQDQLPRGDAAYRLAYVLSPYFRTLPRKGREQSLGTVLQGPLDGSQRLLPEG